MTQWVCPFIQLPSQGLKAGTAAVTEANFKSELGGGGWTGASALIWPTRAGQCIADATGPIKTSVRRELGMIYWISFRGMMPPLPRQRTMRGRRQVQNKWNTDLAHVDWLNYDGLSFSYGLHPFVTSSTLASLLLNTELIVMKAVGYNSLWTHLYPLSPPHQVCI